MPGIVGLITKMPRARAEAELQRMVTALCHEDFYVHGTCVDETLGVYIGWIARRNSFSDGMPLTNERGDVVLVVSGEEFPEPGTRRRLREQGHTFDPTGPSYLVHLYEENPAFLAGLNGRFHGVLTDRRLGTTTLFNDRYGMHRLYYHQCDEAFYFAAEAKAILAVRPGLRRLDPRALGEFVACGCVLEDRTLFQGIHSLPCSAAWIFRNGSLEKKHAYFQPREWEDQPRLAPEAFYRQVRETFARNLPRYFEAPEPVGLSLTGGLDTRMILAWHQPQPESLPCYTFGGMFRDCQDVIVAREVADACRQSHHVIAVDGEFLSDFPHYAQRTVYLGEGCVDVSRSPDLYLSERIRHVAPVRMTGNYGGELLRRVRSFKPVEPQRGLFQTDVMSSVGEAAQTYAEVARAHPVAFAAFKQGPWHLSGVLALEQTQISMRSPYLDNDLVRTVFRAPESCLASNDVCLRLIADGDARLARIRTDHGLAGAGGLSAAGLHGLHTFLFKAEYAYDMGMPQWLARLDHRLSMFRLERLFLGRHKPFHFRVWYRDALAAYLRDVLGDPRARSLPYLERNGLEAAVEGHLRGDRNYTTEIHKVLTLELLHRLFVDQPN